jgi:serine/threonine-protein kinase
MVIAGKYRLESSLAQGGMGSVWRARHMTLDTALAVKFISADVAAREEARRRFEREAKAAAMLQSPHVVQIYDYGMDGDTPYLVMELLAGEDLAARLKRLRQLSPDETSVIVTQVARALRRAAEAGIVHRDLKPSNVFIVQGEDDEELIKVLDFGVAKAPRTLHPDDDTTKLGAVIGSPRYMSPEQARGSPLVDPRSDLWSLAVIAYRALTGELPFNGTDVTDLVLKICSEPAAPPSSVEPSLGPEVDAFFARALDRDPAARFQTAREFARAFAVAAGLPPTSTQTMPTAALMALLRSDPALARIAIGDDASPPHTPPSPSPKVPLPAPPYTRDDTTPAEPAASHRSAQVPKETPTPRPGSIDLHTPTASFGTPHALARRVALGVAGVSSIAAVVLALSQGSAPTRAPILVETAAELPPTPASIAASPASAAPGEQAVTAPPSAEPGASATAVESAPTSAHPSTAASTQAPGRTPPSTVPARPPSKKRNPILGI